MFGHVTANGKALDASYITQSNIHYDALKDYYREQGKLRLICGNQTIEAIQGDILKVIGVSV